MPFFRRLSWTLAVAAVLTTCVSAQQCYYPNGSPSHHTACAPSDSGSACCAADASCLANGLCFQRGIVMRGSCTDKTWDSEACAGYCKQESPGGSISITPCTDDGEQSVFVCGLNNTKCQDESVTFGLIGKSNFALRSAEVSALAAPLVSSVAAQDTATATATAQPSSLLEQAVPVGETCYSEGHIVGLGVGLGTPLLISLCFTLLLWKKERARHPKLMYQLPDDENMDLKATPASLFPGRTPVRSGSSSRKGLLALGESPLGDSYRSRAAPPTQSRETAHHLRTLVNQYQAANENISGGRLQPQGSFELDGRPVGTAFRPTAQGRPGEHEKAVSAPPARARTLTKAPREGDRERTRR